MPEGGILSDWQSLKAWDKKYKESIKYSEKIALLLIFVLVAVGVSLSHINLHLFESWYVREDSLIEWLTVIALASSAVVCFYRVYLLYPFRPKIFIFCLAVMGFIFLFGTGEEISWGQRIFKIKSPSFFIHNNAQGEINVHNLFFKNIKINKVIFGLSLSIMIVIYMVVFPWLYHRYKSFARLLDGWAIPLPRGFHVISCIVLFLIIQLSASGKKGELLEFANCWIFFIILLRPFNRQMFSRRIFRH